MPRTCRCCWRSTTSRFAVYCAAHQARNRRHGHAGHEENERVDGFANAEAEKARYGNSSRRSRADIGQGAPLA